MSELFNSVGDQPDEATELASLKTRFGDGNTFDSEKLAKGKLEADRYIKRLEAEAQEMRQSIGKQATLEEIMTQIREASKQVPPQQPPVTPPAPVADDPKKVETLVSEFMSKKAAEDRTKANLARVTEAVQKAWGADAQLQMNKKARELNVPLEYLSNLAKESPDVFFKTVDLQPSTKVEATPAAPRSQTMTQPVDPNARTKSFYERLKKTDPSKYFSSETQNEMYKNAMKMGADFFDI